MTDLVERWPARTAQLVLAGRVDPPVRLHRLRLSGELCELRDSDLYLSLSESGALLENFGVRVAPGELALLHGRSEGWVAALQMAALTLRTTKDPAQVARALDVRSHAIAEYFIGEVLEQQPPEVAGFMLETSVLDELTADACAAVTGRQDAAALLRSIEAANLFIVALDDDRTSYRYHHLVREVLRAQLRAMDRRRELTLQLRAAEWLESAGDTRAATRYFLAAGQADRALGLLQERVAADLLHDPAAPAVLDLSTVDPSLLTGVPERLLGLAADLLLWGDWVRGGQYLDLLERSHRRSCRTRSWRPGSRCMRSLHCALSGEATETVRYGLAARGIEERTLLEDEWGFGVPLLLLRAYTWLEDFAAVDREAAAARAMPSVADPARLVDLRGAQALAWFEAGRLAEAAEAARAAEADARRLGFQQHPFAVDYLRVLAGAALEQRDFDTAERLTERALSISERFRPVFEFLALLDRARIWAARGQIHDALATVDAARLVLAGTKSVLLARADELEALLRLSLGDLRSAAELASGLPATRRGLLLARVALAAGDHSAAVEHLDTLVAGGFDAASRAGTPGPPGRRRHRARRPRGGRHRRRCAPDSTSRRLLQYGRDDRAPGDALPGRASTDAMPDPFLERIIGAALEVRATQPERPGRILTAPLTDAELRVLKLLPTARLRTDSRRPLHLPQHGEDSPAVDLPEAGSVLALRSD